jgi:hypothetical protein
MKKKAKLKDSKTQGLGHSKQKTLVLKSQSKNQEK